MGDRLRTILLKSLLVRWGLNFREFVSWHRRNYHAPSPQIVKRGIKKKYGIADVQWVETGTYRGSTTFWLADNYPHVYSIEPSVKHFLAASKIAKGRNVTLFNDVSENVLPSLLPTLTGSVNFWLDGHYSAGDTFLGKNICPIVEELSAIENQLHRFNNVVILIDDVRCFLPDHPDSSGYPSVDHLVDWARARGMQWRVEHDIFIMKTCIAE